MSSFSIRKLPKKNRFRVTNKISGKVHARSTTKKKAMSQVRLLNAIQHGFKPKSRKSSKKHHRK